MAAVFAGRVLAAAPRTVGVARPVRGVDADMGATELVGSRLRLRPPVAGDAQALARIGDDIRLARNLARLPHPFSLADAAALIARAQAAAQAGEARRFIIEELSSTTCVGFAGLSFQAARVGELSYWIGHDFHGRGYATEAATLLVEAGFVSWGVERIIAWHGCDNPASRRVQEKLGMRFCGLMGLVFSLGRGQLVACRLMELSKQQWCAGRS